MSGQKQSNDPESAKLVEGRRDDDEDSLYEDKSQNGCWKCCSGCCRFLLSILLFPFVFVLTLLAILVWLILCPSKSILWTLEIHVMLVLFEMLKP
jgi:hypothetical protein